MTVARFVVIILFSFMLLSAPAVTAEKGQMMGKDMMEEGMMSRNMMETHKMMQGMMSMMKEMMGMMKDFSHNPSAAQKKRLGEMMKKMDEMMKMHDEMMKERMDK